MPCEQRSKFTNSFPPDTHGSAVIDDQGNVEPAFPRRPQNRCARTAVGDLLYSGGHIQNLEVVGGISPFQWTQSNRPNIAVFARTGFCNLWAGPTIRKCRSRSQFLRKKCSRI